MSVPKVINPRTGRRVSVELRHANKRYRCERCDAVIGFGEVYGRTTAFHPEVLCARCVASDEVRA